jgi:hypothetical protein
MQDGIASSNSCQSRGDTGRLSSLVINQKAVKTLGIAVPATLLTPADGVIE